ncbi:MAG: hypothetical protein NUV73_02745 [Candidatus Daviesbacteria bacterium]|nr:hypothetical protein [Candidatus Daviesbacteria bacterium]
MKQNMIIDEFRQNKIKGREVLLNKIIETFKKLNPVAIHQFGSGVSGYRDEFSDLDIWVTFQDEIADEIIKKRDSIYSNIS